MKVTITRLFRLTVIFGSPSTRVLSSVTAIAFFFVYLTSQVLDTWFVKLVDFSDMLRIEFGTPARVWGGIFWENIWQFYLLTTVARGCMLRAFSIPLFISDIYSYYYSDMIITFKVYMFMTIWIFIHSHGFKTYIISTSNVNCEQIIIQELW